MGRATSGVTGMRFRDGDSLLSMSVIPNGEDPDVFVVFENGMAKRSPASDWNAKGRGGLGVAVAKITERNGDLAGALTVAEDDEVLVVMGKGNIVRMKVSSVTRRGRNTQGMKFATPGGGDIVVAVARNPERPEVEAESTSPRAARTRVSDGDDVPSVGDNGSMDPERLPASGKSRPRRGR